MHIEFDVVMHSIPSSGWGNVFQIQQASSSHGLRMPGLWVHDTADNAGGSHEGWYLQFEDDKDPSLGDEPLVAGKNYHFEMDWTQSAVFVKINGKTVWDGSISSHKNYASLNVYVSCPQYTVDATVSNIVISTDLSCWVTGYECASYEVCGEDGECGRDCSAFQIDDYLLQCSAEFEGNEADISGLQNDVSTINTKIENVEKTINTKIENVEADLSGKATAISTINTEIQSIKTALDSKADTSSIQELKDSIKDIQLHLHQLSGDSAHTAAGMVDEGMAADSMMTLTAKDMAIVALLAVNLVIIATLCVVCRAGSGGKYVYGQ